MNEDNTDIPVPRDIYQADTVGTTVRGSLDTVTNKYGDNLLSLCKAVPLRICNGRKLGDTLGSFTCFTNNGQSCVDYCLSSPSLYKSVKTLSVGHPVLTLSDHCPLTAVVCVNVKTRVDSSVYEFITKPSKLAWNKDISFRFENILQTQAFSERFSAFSSQNFDNDQSGIDLATDELSNLLIEGAMRSTSSVQYHKSVKPSLKICSKKLKKKRKNHPKWHDKSCADAHRDVVVTSKLLKGDPKNPYLKGKLVTETKIYNRLVKSKQKEFVDKMFSDLDSIKRNDPKGYMDLIKSMRDGNFDKEVSDDTSDISPQIWFSHFSKLLARNVNSDSNIGLQTLIGSEIDHFRTELDNPFT